MSEQDEQVMEATNSTEEQELEITSDDVEETEDVETLKAQITEKDTFARQAVARAKKAEAELKALRGNQKPAEATQPLNKTQNGLSEEDVEVKILRAQKVPQDEIDYLKKLAKVNGTSIIEAQSDELYTAFKVKKEDEAKAQKAKLGASRGSGSVKKEKEIFTPGLTDAEHRELWNRQNGR